MDLRVEIPRRFKESLERRFDLRKARSMIGASGRYCVISQCCELCEYYRNNCGYCPFGKFGKEDGRLGCMQWMWEVVGDRFYFWLRVRYVAWWEGFDEEARRQIKELKRKARKLITWI